MYRLALSREATRCGSGMVEVGISVVVGIAIVVDISVEEEMDVVTESMLPGGTLVAF